MAPPRNDDYSDDDEELEDYTETKTLLGYAEEEPVGDDSVSHLGGEPVSTLRYRYRSSNI